MKCDECGLSVRHDSKIGEVVICPECYERLFSRGLNRFVLDALHHTLKFLRRWRLA
jgi:predicted amidophosphoribosyltransferase